ncbi:MAG: substrate-binding domain-containing protein, partial [Chloroflexi bacterium]|nr:substrate-binding domain-containing protein [Chloroflexota bacterium]MBU1747327.1 substrate-binding domain-containing protein [Chloroflexota bacterium]
MSRRFVGLVLALVILLAPAGCAAPEKTPLRVLMAGSLLIPFDHLEAAFERTHPNVDVLPEGHGSIQVIRHVTELHELADVVVSADHTLIPALMYTATDAETGRPYADWYVDFATNRLTLAYTRRSAYADEINADNWYEVIARPGVRLGLADPRFDAAGYRGLMALQLAEVYYDDHLIFDNAITGRFESAIRVRKEGAQWFILVPEIVQ